MFYVAIGDTDTPRGQYTVTLTNPAEIGAHTVELLVPNALPTLTFNPLVSETNETSGVSTYTASWDSADVDDGNAFVTLHLAPNHNEHSGALIGGEVFESTAEPTIVPADALLLNDPNDRTFTFNSDRMDVASGEYFLLAIIDDGRNAPVFVHGDEPIRIENANAPGSVENLRVSAANGSAIVEWDPVLGADAYRVYYGLDTNDAEDDTVERVLDHTKTIIDGLSPGAYYRFSVRAVSSVNSVQGPASDPVIAAVPNVETTAKGVEVANNPPVIHSTPPQRIRYGDLYTHQVIAEDLDGHTLAYALVSGPAGLTMSAEGLV